MSDILYSANMNMPVPVATQDPGPDYANNINSSLLIIDSHNHVLGTGGVPINPAGININSDLTFGGNNATLLRSTRFSAQASPIALATDLNCVFVSGVDLYYNDGNGNHVRITQSGAVSGTPGSIANLVSPASATYVAADSTFVWQSDANTPATMDGGSFIFRKITASSNGITMSPPSSLASNYTLTLPALPASQKIMTLDASGNITAPYTVDAATIVISSNVIQIPSSVALPGSPSTAADFTVGDDLIVTDDASVGGDIAITGNSSAAVVTATTKFALGSYAQMSAVNQYTIKQLDASAVLYGAVVTSVAPTSSALYICRGNVSSAAAIVSGEGFSVAHPGTGQYSISFSTAYAVEPAVLITPVRSGAAAFAVLDSNNTSGAVIRMYNAAGTLTDIGFSFLAIGVQH